MEENETNTIQNLEENKRLIAELIEEYNRRIVDAPGDNILAEFNSVVIMRDLPNPEGYAFRGWPMTR